MDVMLDISHSKLDPERREKLTALLKRSEVPTIPVVARKLLELCRNDTASFAEFARLIEADQGLASRILRVANSAYYGLRHKATSLERAISALGLKYVKTISLGFHLAKALYGDGLQGFNMAEFWKHNLIRAVIARQVARTYCPSRREEAFLIGLLQDCGIPFLVEAIGSEYAHLWQEQGHTQNALYRMERELFFFDHLKAAAMIVKQWELPEILAEPICSHHLRSQSQPSMVEKVQLYQIGYFAGAITLKEPLALSEEDITLKDYAYSAFGLDIEDINELLIKSKQEFAGISQLFADVLPEHLDITELLENARRTISEMILEDTIKHFDLEDEVQRFASEWEMLASQMAPRTPTENTPSPVGLNRMDTLRDFLDVAGDHVRTMTAPVMVICVDVDNFSAFGDRYGMDTAGRILNDLAALLRQLFGEVGCVAHQDKDRFYIALIGPNIKSAVKLAEGLLNKIRQFCFTVDTGARQEKIRLTASIGMIFYEPGSFPAGVNEILELAEQQMLRVKDVGKDGLYFQVVPPAVSGD